MTRSEGVPVKTLVKAPTRGYTKNASNASYASWRRLKDLAATGKGKGGSKVWRLSR